MKQRDGSKVLMVYMTAPTVATADRLAASLVRERLAACVNRLGPMRSVYRWNGRVERAREVALLAKTRADRFEALSDRVRELHPYVTPCIVAWPVERGLPAFLEWVAEESRPARSD